MVAEGKESFRTFDGMLQRKNKEGHLILRYLTQLNAPEPTKEGIAEERSACVVFLAVKRDAAGNVVQVEICAMQYSLNLRFSSYEHKRI